MALVGGGSVRRLILVGIGIALLAGEGVTLAMNDRAVGSRAVIAQETEPNSPADVAGPVEIALVPELDALQWSGAATLEPQATPPTAVPTDSPAELRTDPAPSVKLPIRLRVPSLGVNADVEYVELAGDGAMDVPKYPGNVAWYQPGPKPGEPGNAIIAGHVDWGGRTAVFWGLRTLTPGNVIEVVAADGGRYEFVVDWLKWYDAETAPVDEVFGQSGATELTMITCGGSFDQRTRQYLSRLVVRSTLRGQ